MELCNPNNNMYLKKCNFPQGIIIKKLNTSRDYNGIPNIVNFNYLKELNIYFFRVQTTGLCYLFTPNLELIVRQDLSCGSYEVDALTWILKYQRNRRDLSHKVLVLMEHADNIMLEKYMVDFIETREQSVLLLCCPLNVIAFKKLSKLGIEYYTKFLDRMLFVAVYLQRILPKDIVQIITNYLKTYEVETNLTFKERLFV
jgi:hypothetical protein